MSSNYMDDGAYFIYWFISYIMGAPVGAADWNAIPTGESSP